MTPPNRLAIEPLSEGFGRRPPGQRFEDVVARLFAALDFAVEREVPFQSGDGRYRTDLVAQAGSVRSVIEIKALRSRTPNLTDFERAAVVVANARDQLNADHAVLLRAKDEGNAVGARFEPLRDAFLLDLGR